jgi:hypothetical protein
MHLSFFNSLVPPKPQIRKQHAIRLRNCSSQCVRTATLVAPRVIPPESLNCGTKRDIATTSDEDAEGGGLIGIDLGGHTAAWDTQTGLEKSSEGFIYPFLERMA